MPHVSLSSKSSDPGWTCWSTSRNSCCDYLWACDDWRLLYKPIHIISAGNFRLSTVSILFPRHERAG
jgi:hypothetical protein